MMKQTQRLFTLAEANRTLPLVRRVIRDVVDTHKRISELYGQSRRLIDEGETERAARIDDEIQELFATKEDYVREFESIGCEFKDPRLGLVDFPARRGDKSVYLCWRLDEPEIGFWHDLEAGFAGRQAIDGEFD